MKLFLLGVILTVALAIQYPGMAFLTALITAKLLFG
jgi:hypothetical protein